MISDITAILKYIILNYVAGFSELYWDIALYFDLIIPNFKYESINNVLI